MIPTTPCFCCCVSDVSWHADEPVDRRHVDDGSSSAVEHDLDFSFHAVEDAAEVDVEDIAPGVEGVVGGRRDRSRDAGDVEGDIETAVGRVDIGDLGVGRAWCALTDSR